jgi:hypothetical protein
MFAGFLLVGGNSNNGANAGASYFNLNNSFANRNWNIGACLTNNGIVSLIYLYRLCFLMQLKFLFT